MIILDYLGSSEVILDAPDPKQRSLSFGLSPNIQVLPKRSGLLFLVPEHQDWDQQSKLLHPIRSSAYQESILHLGSAYTPHTEGRSQFGSAS